MIKRISTFFTQEDGQPRSMRFMVETEERDAQAMKLFHYKLEERTPGIWKLTRATILERGLIREWHLDVPLQQLAIEVYSYILMVLHPEY